MEGQEEDFPNLITLLWYTAAGMRCGKMVPKRKYLADQEVRSNAAGSSLIPTMYDTLVPGLKLPNIFSDVILSPVKSTFKVSPWNPDIGLAFTEILNLDGTPFSLCPRNILKRAQAQLKELGFELKAALEIEFVL